MLLIYLLFSVYMCTYICVEAGGQYQTSSLVPLLCNFLRQGLSLTLRSTESGDWLGVQAEEHTGNDRYIMASFSGVVP